MNNESITYRYHQLGEVISRLVEVRKDLQKEIRFLYPHVDKVTMEGMQSIVVSLNSQIDRLIQKQNDLG